MIDLLAFIASDPTAIPLLGVFLTAVGMYPVGLMLGSACSPCCEEPCAACPADDDGKRTKLPETITVTFGGFTDKSPGPNLCGLEFTACYGAGASGFIAAPGGDPDEDKGPISKVTIASGGSGYAVMGREEPTLTLTGSGSGATFTATLAQDQDDCDIDYWRISSVSTSGGGTGYSDGEALTIAVADGDTVSEYANVKINTTRSQPTIDAEVTSGAGCALSVTLAQSPGTPATWAVDSIAVTDGGSDYADGEQVVFSKATGDVQVEAAAATIITSRTTPSVSLSFSSFGGSGAAATATLTKATSTYTGRDIWSVSSITIDNAGSGYAPNEAVMLTIADGSEEPLPYFAAHVSSVGGSGEVLAISITSAGAFYKSTGIVDDVIVGDGGAYYHDDGVADTVTVTNGGKYWRENAELPPYVADVTVTISQTLPSDGSGGEISATVDDDTSSPTFGQITGLTIDDPGDDYLAWEWTTNDCCGHRLNDKPIVLTRINNSNRFSQSATSVGSFSVGNKVCAAPCVYAHSICGGWKSPFVRQLFPGLDTPSVNYLDILVGVAPDLTINASVLAPNMGENYLSSTECEAIWSGEEAIETCEDISWTATDFNGRTISIESGGDYDPEAEWAGGGAACTSCCQGDEQVPGEIEVQLEDSWAATHPAYPDVSGNYVLGREQTNRWIYQAPDNPPGPTTFGIELRIHPSYDGQILPNSCDCTKGCRVWAWAGYPVPGFVPTGPNFYDSAFACEPYWGGAGCQPGVGCEETPICYPSSGRSFTILGRAWPWPPPQPHQTAFTITVQ